MPIWVEPISMEALTARSENTIVTHFDIAFTEIGDDYLVATMPVTEKNQQPLKILNGGASCALAETLGSTAANFCVDQSTHFCVGVDINANHLRPASAGTTVRAVAKPIHLGRGTQVWEIKIFNADEKLSCIARLTMMVKAR